MTIRDRRDRERAERHRLIVAAARRLADAEGWEAVTTRRLADEVEYSQPVLYSHFANKDAIVAAVAVAGFAELVEPLVAARATASDPSAPAAPTALAAFVTAYVDFADRNPALYEAMFTRTTGLPFAQPDAPAPLHAAFDALRDALRPTAGDRDLDLLTEVTWSALHGLVTLARDGRLPADARDRRLALLVDLVTTPA
jgi:AcrR family transcriptional regulator